MRCPFFIVTSALSPGIAAGGSPAQGVALVPETRVIVWRYRIPSHCLHAYMQGWSHIPPARGASSQ